jgi:predicted N-acyltransferase
MPIRFLSSLDAEPACLSALSADGDPFLYPAFLAAAERHGAVRPDLGWQAHHASCVDNDGHCLGLMPLYVRTHSYGDFSGDFGWERAWRQAGLAYYPKLVTGIPYTPSPGPRFLLNPLADRDPVISTMIDAAVDLARDRNLSVWQCLFVREGDLPLFDSRSLTIREGVQYHWHNNGYRDFQDFLAVLTAKRRKEVRRERRRVAESGVRIRTYHGDDIPDALWSLLRRHYRGTIDRYGGIAPFDEGFFREVGKSLGRQMVVFAAFMDDRPVASSICYRDERTLFGRHWGADIELDCLHFELCYYQGIEYCLREGLQRFEPGAGGEHKIARGFMPVKTFSVYWIGDPLMRRSVEHFAARERIALKDYRESVLSSSPYAAVTGVTERDGAERNRRGEG